MQHAAEYALARHDAVTDLLPDGTALVALLADLRDLKPGLARPQTRTDRQFLETEPLRYDILAKSPETHIDAQLAEILDFLQAKETDLTMPAARMRIPGNAPFRLEQHLIYRLLKRPFLLTDTQCMDLSHSFSLLPDTWPGHPGRHYSYPQSGVPPVYDRLPGAPPAAGSHR